MEEEYAEFMDPLSGVWMVNPVTSSNCNHSFSKDTITEYIKKGNKVCPLCNKPMSIDDLKLDEVLGQIIVSMQKMAIENEKILTQQKKQQQPHPDESSKRVDINGKFTIRELTPDDIKEASKLLDKAGDHDSFVKYFFGDLNYKTSAQPWFCEKMLSYAIKKARVWGIVEQNKSISGVMIAQAPLNHGVSMPDMMKVGMSTAPYHLGMKPLSKVLTSSDFTEKIHQKEMPNSNHWYISAITVDEKLRKSKRGSALIKTVLNIADKENLQVYTECDKLAQEFFMKHAFVNSNFHKQFEQDDSPHFYSMIRPNQK